MNDVKDHYKSYFELAAREVEGGSYRIQCRAVPGARVLVMAPHGGDIEYGTSDITREAAGTEHSFYMFEGLRSRSFRHLHITSTRFDEPRAVEMAGSHRTIVTIHGCSDMSRVIYMGGLDNELKGRLAKAFTKAGYDARVEGHHFPAIQPDNICNRSQAKAGVQLELGWDARVDVASRRVIAAIIRHSLAA